jgi:16S rRNA (adenine1518-N6/adenine1519-N6)-dimethyltransferase
LEPAVATLYEETRAAMRDSGFRARKRLGQNFLVHERVIDSILKLLALHPDDDVLEIGPGLGFLTRRLVEGAQNVWAVEIDDSLAERLRQGPLSANPAFHLIHDDILTVLPDTFLPPKKIKLAANLPYSISSPVLFRLIDWRAHFSSMVLMLQKEVAERIASAPGTKAYGSLSVWLQAHGRITDKVMVSAEAFYPKPKVRSTILRIEFFERPLIAEDDRSALRALVRSAFGQRRKTLHNALSSWLKIEKEVIDKFLVANGIDPQRRGETLGVEEFVTLAGALKQLSPAALA